MSMGKIRVLPPALQNQIAAGEVVERPASVVKELVENSLDAGAANIVVSLEQGGRALIQVRDDGHGIPAEELELAVTRHATSKIGTFDDITAIRSFGFRGEALPSIASVSRFRITSRAHGAEEASFVDVHNGLISDRGIAAAATGTEVLVRDLFAALPARLKFLRSVSAEHRRCQDIVHRFALACLEVDFELFVQGRSVLRFLHGQTLIQRLEKFWPPSITAGLRPVTSHKGGMQINGVTGAPEAAQGRPDRIWLYVNNRPVQDRLLLKAVRDAYAGRLLSREYPQSVLFVNIPPEEVDVNVHPAKAEIRFSDSGSVYTAVRSAVIAALGSGSVFPIPQAQVGTLPPEEFPSPGKGPDIPSFSTEPRRQVRFDVCESAAPFPARSETSLPPLQNQVEQPPRLNARSVGYAYLGQLLDTYLILRRGTEELLLVDQHAAHERVLMDALTDPKRATASSPLALPLEMALHQSEHEALTRLWPDLLRIGFRLEMPDPRRCRIMSVPSLLKPGQAVEFLRASCIGRETDLHAVHALLACRAAVKAGERLGPSEAMELIEEWLSCPEKEHCPHGRPTIVAWGRKDLERLFKRTG